MNCIVLGCRNKLDENGVPIEYCDYQQGRCPMQRQNRETPSYIVYLILVFSVICAILIGYFT
jgi:hypothetical protein